MIALYRLIIIRNESIYTKDIIRNAGIWKQEAAYYILDYFTGLFYYII